MEQRKLGLIGLGAIGQIYAGHLLKANSTLVVFDAVAEKMQQVAAQGATPAASAKHLASQCDFVILSLPSPDAVHAALLGPQGVLAGAQPGLTIIDASTIDPDTCRRLYAAARSVCSPSSRVRKSEPTPEYNVRESKAYRWGISS